MLLLDDDVEAEPGLVAGHARHHARRDDLAVLGYMPPVPPQRGDPDAFSVLLYAEAYEGRCESYEAGPGPDPAPPLGRERLAAARDRPARSGSAATPTTSATTRIASSACACSATA